MIRYKINFKNEAKIFYFCSFFWPRGAISCRPMLMPIRMASMERYFALGRRDVDVPVPRLVLGRDFGIFFVGQASLCDDA